MSGSAVRELMIAVGIDTSEIDDADKETKKLAKSWGELGKQISDALGGPLVQLAFGYMVHKVAELGTEIRNQAAQIGVTTDEIQRLRFASESAGMESEGLANSITKLGRKAADAARNGGDAAKLFRRLGIDLKDANGEVRPGIDLFRDASDAIARMPNRTEQAAAAMALFEEEGGRMLPLLAQGSAGLDQLGSDFEELGGGLSGETIDSIAEFNAQWARLKLSMLSFVSKIGAVLFPAFSWLGSIVTKVTSGFGRLVAGTKLVESAFVVLGALAVRSIYRIVAANAAFLVSWLAAWGPWIVIIAIVIAAIDDLWTAWTGGQSVIGDVIDSMFGLGTTQAVIQGIKDKWTELVEAIPQLAESWNYVIDQLAAKWHGFVNGFVNAIPAPLRDILSKAGSFAVNMVSSGSAGGLGAQAGANIGGATVRPSSSAAASNTVNSRNQVNITVQGTADGSTVNAIDRAVQRALEQNSRDLADLSPRHA